MSSLEDPDNYAECQYDTGHPGGICGARCDGSDYCRRHTPTAWAADAMSRRPSKAARELAQEPPW